MKLTHNKALSMLAGLKNGLSIPLALILLATGIRPVQAQTTPVPEVVALFPSVQPEVPETASTPEKSQTVQDVLLSICQDRGYDEDCAKHLMGILMQESMGKANAVGDHGMAHGWFQINRYYNPDVSVECAEDLTCSANWTLDHLEKKGYGKNAAWNNWAIQCHNGCGISKTYVKQVLTKGKIYWDQPISLDQSVEIALANK